MSKADNPCFFVRIFSHESGNSTLNDMAIRVNGEIIGDEQFHREFLELSGGRTPQQVQQQSNDEYRHLLQLTEHTVLRSTLFQQLAIRENITITAREIEEARRSVWGSSANQTCGTGVDQDIALRLLVMKVQTHLTRHVPRPDRREVEAVYQNRSSSYALQERWLVSHIVRIAETETERTQVREVLALAEKDLNRGKPFATVADRYSDCKGNGGSLGWLSRGMMVPEFEEKVFSLQRRKASDVFETIFGLHIAIVHDWKPAGVQPLEDVRADLARSIFEERKQAHLNQIVQECMRHATIEFLEEPLPDQAISETR